MLDGNMAAPSSVGDVSGGIDVSANVSAPESNPGITLSDGSGGNAFPFDHGDAEAQAEANRQRMLERWMPEAADNRGQYSEGEAASAPMDFSDVDPALIQAAQNFAPLLSQLQQQGLGSADAVQAAYAEQQAQQGLMQVVEQTRQGLIQAVVDGTLDKAAAERIFAAETAALQNRFQLEATMRQTATMAYHNAVSQLSQQYPTLSPDVVAQLVYANPQMAPHLAATMNQQLLQMTQQQVTNQAAHSARQRQLHPARAAGAPGGSPSSSAPQAGSRPFTWLGYLSSLGMKVPGR